METRILLKRRFDFEDLEHALKILNPNGITSGSSIIQILKLRHTDRANDDTTAIVVERMNDLA